MIIRTYDRVLSSQYLLRDFLGETICKEPKKCKYNPLKRITEVGPKGKRLA